MRRSIPFSLIAAGALALAAPALASAQAPSAAPKLSLATEQVDRGGGRALGADPRDIGACASS